MNCHRLLRTLASAALVVGATLQTASALTILDYVEVYGVHPATGELRLNSLNSGERPLPGSYFDVDGPGPIAPYSLAPFEWITIVNRTALFGFDLPNQLQFRPNGPGLAIDVPEQFWLMGVPGNSKQGNGDWVVRTVPGGVGVPDAGATLTLFATSLAGLAMAGRRWRVATR